MTAIHASSSASYNPGFIAAPVLLVSLMDEFSPASDTPSVLDDSTDDGREEAKQLKSLESYVNSLPYTCETQEEMDVKLNLIVERLVICAKTANWAAMIGWDSSLQ